MPRDVSSHASVKQWLPPMAEVHLRDEDSDPGSCDRFALDDVAHRLRQGDAPPRLDVQWQPVEAEVHPGRGELARLGLVEADMDGTGITVCELWYEGERREHASVDCADEHDHQAARGPWGVPPW